MSKGRRPNPITSFIHRGQTDDQAVEPNGTPGEIPSGTEPAAVSTVWEPSGSGKAQESGEQNKQGKQFGLRARTGKVPFKTEVPSELLEAVKDAAYWKRERMAWITETALRTWLAEAVAANGGPFEPRPDDLPTGRPMK